MLKKISKYFDKDGQKLMRKYPKYFEQLDQCIIDDDKRCAARIMTKFVKMGDLLIPKTANKDYLLACDGDYTDMNSMRKVQQAFMTGCNATVRETMDGYLKPLANQLNQIIMSCESGRCKHSYP